MLKISLALLSAAVAVSAAQPHGHHQHQHVHKARNADAAPGYVTVAGPTEIVYVLNGQTISEAEVQQGIKNGSLVFANDGQLTPKPAGTYKAPPAYAAPSSSTASSTSTTLAAKATPTQYNADSSAAAAVQSTVSNIVPSYGGGSSGTGVWGSDATGIDSDFPDGQLDCSTFPSAYGAVAVHWTGLGGWTGVQSPGSSTGNGYGNIMTVTSGGSCTEGAYCSYACPPGYQKSQWPTTQGSTGQSVGGLKCSGGKLHLTNPSMCTQLCMKGSDQVEILVQNKMTQNVAVCRTDYPGTESETVPVDVPGGGQSNLTCPDADNYYKWQGGKTSAQYYVNPAGVSVEDGCQWGQSGNPWGNFAPLNLGVGYSNGAAWLSIMQNAPTTDAKLDFCVEIIGDGVSGTCKYSNGQYCGGANYDDCSSTTGCTVSLSSGTATFVFSDSS
ncbi:hypothetical protein DOTSEDRAFT_68521 [Dothistroma septosporum NZE10]|uniref:Glycoside hydrolase family 132 protein n=1 Tax=Dothistroma septosporum (strain NZE10 / CBS 128990) TaxID=675120 RepID=N1Q253_DOTSN|nr:hypothetical protein DOTSEDRAFT_68521 [Dothistroma septosporum NZE10]